ncbi:MAG: MoaD/ThiS family protein [Desulfatiglandaceae bacterium]
MKLRVKLYGTFRRRFPGYQVAKGMEIEITPGVSVKNLLDRLGIRENQGGVVVMDGRILNTEDEIPSGVEVQIFQGIHGG